MLNLGTVMKGASSERPLLPAAEGQGAEDVFMGTGSVPEVWDQDGPAGVLVPQLSRTRSGWMPGPPSPDSSSSSCSCLSQNRLPAEDGRRQQLQEVQQEKLVDFYRLTDDELRRALTLTNFPSPDPERECRSHVQNPYFKLIITFKRPAVD